MTTVRRHVRSWSPPTPTLETAHDVRRLRVCEKCGALGSDLLRLRSLFQDRKAFAHAYCLISKQRDGWEVFTRLPSEEIGKITMSEWKALGIPYGRIERAWRAALKREAKSRDDGKRVAKPRRKHTPYNPNACPICAPGRCEVARRREQPR